MPRRTADLEHRAARLVNARCSRQDAGLAGQVVQVVRDAYRRGVEDTALALAQAYQLSLADGDLDALADALTGLLPTGCGLPDGAEGPSRA